MPFVEPRTDALPRTGSWTHRRVPVDGTGVIPDALERGLRGRVKAVVLTPRAQNPSGAAFDAGRARDIRTVLARFPEVLVIEDDHAGATAGTAYLTVCNSHDSRLSPRPSAWSPRLLRRTHDGAMRSARRSGRRGSRRSADPASTSGSASRRRRPSSPRSSQRAGRSEPGTYRLRTPPAIRVTIARLQPPEAKRFAADLLQAVGASQQTYSA